MVFFVNEAKSQWTPTHRLRWLGLDIDLERFVLGAPQEKRARARADVFSLLTASVTARRIAKLPVVLSALEWLLGILLYL